MNLQPKRYPGIEQNKVLNNAAGSLLIHALAGTGSYTLCDSSRLWLQCF